MLHLVEGRVFAGSSSNRWEVVARGEFTIYGCIEMARMMVCMKPFGGVFTMVHPT